jgi:hypothetical protein
MHRVGEARDDVALIATADDLLKGLYGKAGRLIGPAARHPTGHHLGPRRGKARTGCCGGLAAGGNLATIVVGPAIKASHNATYSHSALVRSIETLFHVPYLATPATLAPQSCPPRHDREQAARVSA